MAKFHVQTWQFWKSAHIPERAARRVKISSISTDWGRKCPNVQLLGLWPMAKFHAQIWQFWKSTHISKTAAHRVKISSNPWGRKRVYVKLWQMTKLVLKQSVKAHGPLVFFFCFFFSFSLTCDLMGAKIAKHYSHKSLLNFLKLFVNFCLQYSHNFFFPFP